MTRLKFTIFALLLTIAGWQAQAQVRFGVKGGMNASKFHTTSDDGIIADYKNYFSFQAGIFTEIPLGNILSIRPELLFSGKGAHNEMEQTLTAPVTSGYSDITDQWKTTSTPYYLQLPIYVKAGFEAGKAGKFIVGAGPYAACGLMGKEKVQIKVYYENDVSGKTPHASGKGEMDLFKKDKLEAEMYFKDAPSQNVTIIELQKAYFKRFDAGVSGFAGYELNMGLFATISYDMGLYNIDNTDSNNLYNRTFTVSIGYKF